MSNATGDPVPIIPGAPFFVASSLFEDRVPEAAAYQLATVLAEATEYAIQSMEWGEYKAGVSGKERRRAKQAARTLIRQCIELKVAPRGLMGRDCKRLAYYMLPSMQWWRDDN